MGRYSVIIAVILLATLWIGTSRINTRNSHKPTFNKAQYSTTDPTSRWVIVNKQHPLNPKTYAPSDLVDVGNGQFLRSEAASALETMFADAKKEGVVLEPDSGYRAYSTQVAAYDSEVEGMGQAVADRESARPGYSEHQTGWAIDIGGNGCHIEDCFGGTKAGKWAADNAYKYGYIQRYTSANSAITGYRAESWHYRYVGKSLALELHNEHIPSLEDFFKVSGGSHYN